MNMPASATRVQENTPRHINEEIRRRTEESVARHALSGREAIDRRIAELDREWDIERCLEANAAGISLAGLLLYLSGSRAWILVPVAVSAFLLQHALQGWCPPVEVFRRLGIRTRKEIESERNALKALRGDYGEVKPIAEEDHRDAVRAAVDAARR